MIVKIIGWFIENEELFAGDNSAGEENLLALTTRESTEARFLEALNVESFKGIVDALFRIRLKEFSAIERARSNDFIDGSRETVVKLWVLGHVADLVFMKIISKFKFARGKFDLADKAFEQSGLSAAVRADDTEEIAWF